MFSAFEDDDDLPPKPLRMRWKTYRKFRCNAGGKPELPLGSARGFDLSSGRHPIPQGSRPGSEGPQSIGMPFLAGRAPSIMRWTD